MQRIDTHVPGALHQGLVFQELGDELLVYNMSTNAAHCLNREATVIWRLCDSGRSVGEIVSEFEASGHGTINSDYVWLALDQLSSCGLIDAVPGTPRSTSRRTAIKNIGLGLAVALPVISSLVTPRNSFAATSCVCVNPGSCLTQTSCPSTTNCNGAGVCAP